MYIYIYTYTTRPLIYILGIYITINLSTSLYSQVCIYVELGKRPLYTKMHNIYDVLCLFFGLYE